MKLYGYILPVSVNLRIVQERVRKMVADSNNDIGECIWQASDGRNLKLHEMSDLHVNNCITFHLDNISLGNYHHNEVLTALTSAFLMLVYRQHRIRNKSWTLGTKLKAYHNEPIEE